MITLVDFVPEPLTTLEAAIQGLGFGACRASRPDQAAPVGPIILMGGGPFASACAQLKASGWWRELPQLAANGRPVVGINLGLHLLAEGSEECPRGAGLGLIPGIVRRLSPTAKAPHWGWSPVRQHRPHPLYPEITGGWLFFSHCHALEPTSETLSIAIHGQPFSVLECRGRTVGIQSHLEKSGAYGHALLGKLLAALGEQFLEPFSEHCN